MLKFLVIIIIILFSIPITIFAEELTLEDIDEIEEYGKTAYLIYLVALTLLGIGVIIAGLLIQNNMGTKNMLIFASIIILITLLIMFY
jgi:uncharacterized membrane protein YiaA